MDFSEIMNIILSGGLVGTAAAIGSLRATVRKAKAEAMKAEADAEGVRVDNAEHATRVLVSNIVVPLKEELNATRKDLQANKREMARLRKAIDTANSCRHHDDCPVLGGLRKQQEEHDGGEDTDGIGKHRQRERKPTGGTGTATYGTCWGLKEYCDAHPNWIIAAPECNHEVQYKAGFSECCL